MAASFGLIQYEPDNKFGKPRVLEVRFAHRRTGESPGDPAHYTGERIVLGPGGETLIREFDEAKVGDFRDPVWTLVEDLNRLLGGAPQTWARGSRFRRAASGPRRTVADIVEQRVRRVVKHRADPELTTESVHVPGDRREQLIVAAL